MLPSCMVETPVAGSRLHGVVAGAQPWLLPAEPSRCGEGGGAQRAARARPMPSPGHDPSPASQGRRASRQRSRRWDQTGDGHRPNGADGRSDAEAPARPMALTPSKGTASIAGTWLPSSLTPDVPEPASRPSRADTLTMANGARVSGEPLHADHGHRLADESAVSAG